MMLTDSKLDLSLKYIPKPYTFNYVEVAYIIKG